jgi:hypothetical protein
LGTIANEVIVVAIIFGWGESTSRTNNTTSQEDVKKKQAVIPSE